MTLRPVLALILSLFAVILVSCGGPTEVKAPTYTAAQIDKIEQYGAVLFKNRDRLERELTTEIETGDWSDVVSLIHGPLGEIRQDMSNLARNLTPVPRLQSDARQVAKDFFKDLVRIDEAAQKQSSTSALRAYDAAIGDLDEFLDITLKALEGAKVS